MCGHHEFVICDMFYTQPYGEMIGSMKCMYVCMLQITVIRDTFNIMINMCIGGSKHKIAFTN
jgi:hypothetical protein